MRRTNENEKPQVGEHHHKTDQEYQSLKRHKREGQFPNGMRFINVRHKNIFFKMIYTSKKFIFLGTLWTTTFEL
jgi:hypothetical protein